MKDQRKKIEKYCRALYIAAAVLLVMSCLATLWSAVGTVSYLTADPDAIDTHVSSGSLIISQRRFSAIVEPGRFAPTAYLDDGTSYGGLLPQQTGVVFFSVGLLMGLTQCMLFFFCILLFSHALERPFDRSVSKNLRRIGFLVLTLALLPDLLLTVCLSLFAGGIWNFYPDGLPLTGVLSGVVLIASSHIFDYGTFLQQEYDETV